MGGVFAPSLIVVAFLSRLGLSVPGLLGASGRPGTSWHRAASPGAAIGVPACAAQKTYLHIIGR
jgi:hypothetical protein